MDDHASASGTEPDPNNPVRVKLLEYTFWLKAVGSNLDPRLVDRFLNDENPYNLGGRIQPPPSPPNIREEAHRFISSNTSLASGALTPEQKKRLRRKQRRDARKKDRSEASAAYVDKVLTSDWS